MPLIKYLIQIPAPHGPNLGNPPASPLSEIRHSPLTELTYSQDSETGSMRYGAIYKLRTGSNLFTPDGPSC